MRKICVEEHWNDADLDEITVAWLKRAKLPPLLDPLAVAAAHSRVKDFEEFRIPFMDEAGISVQVLSTTSPGIQGLEDAGAAAVAAIKANDTQAEIIRRHPDRFAGLAALPTQDPTAAADELERAVTQLGFKGAMVQGHTNGAYLDEDQFQVLWERAEALQVPICLHIAEPPARSRSLCEGHPELMGPIWSWGVEAATHALRIIGAGIFDVFPNATLVLGHLGESLPYLLGRLDEGYGMAVKGKILLRPFSDYFKKNIFVNTSGRYNPEALECAVSALGADRVLLAADYPYVLPSTAVQQVERSHLSDSDKEAVYHGNAERLLRL
jgi:2,3-dihydroxybenzoate decarboxylase